MQAMCGSPFGGWEKEGEPANETEARTGRNPGEYGFMWEAAEELRKRKQI